MNAWRGMLASQLGFVHLLFVNFLFIFFFDANTSNWNHVHSYRLLVHYANGGRWENSGRIFWER